MKFDGRCDCGAITLSVEDDPPHLTDCNCSICHRLGTIWLHTTSDKVTVQATPEKTVRYVREAGNLAIVTCVTCGCTTHWENLKGGSRMGVNARMFPPDSIAALTIRKFDGADTWKYIDT